MIQKLLGKFKIVGATDETLIGNDGDKLKVITTPDIASNNSIDPFERAKVSNPDTTFATTHRMGKHGHLFAEKITGSATSTHDADIASVVLATTSATNDEVIRQTRRYMPYFPGKGALVYLTGNFEGQTTGVRKRYGIFDDKDGFFVELDGTDTWVVLRSSVTGSVSDARKVKQADWNLDTLDGNGPSGITLDISKQFILVIQYQWLGSGRARFGFNIDGVTRFVHAFDSSNNITTPYSTSGDLPIRMEIKNVSGSEAASMHMTCVTHISDGGDVNAGFINHLDTDTTTINISTTETAIGAIRMKSTSNRYSVEPLSAQFVMTTGTGAALIKFYYLASVTASWTSAGADSIVEYAVGSAITAFDTTGAHDYDSTYLQVGGTSTIQPYASLQSSLVLGRDIDGVSDILLCTGRTTLSSSNILAKMAFREYQ